MTTGSLILDEGAVAGNENCGGRLDAELFGIIALVPGHADAIARINEEKGLSHGNIHEGLHIGQNDGLLVDFDADIAAQRPTEDSIALCICVYPGIGISA